VTRAHHLDGWRIDLTLRPGVPRLLPGAALAHAVAATLTAAGAPRPASLSIVLSDDAELAELNEGHLGGEGATDVLSFPFLPPSAYPRHAVSAVSPQPAAGSAPAFALPPGRRPHLGDIVVSVERAVAQASQGRGGHDGTLSWAPADELRLLVIHATLHVCGWDHADPDEEAAMRAFERRLLGLAPS
jgi:probable rRNA maturation factor